MSQSQSAFTCDRDLTCCPSNQSDENTCSQRVTTETDPTTSITPTYTCKHIHTCKHLRYGSHVHMSYGLYMSCRDLNLWVLGWGWMFRYDREGYSKGLWNTLCQQRSSQRQKDVHICVAQSSIAHCSNPNTVVSVCESKPTCYTHIRGKRDQMVCREVLLWGLSASSLFSN